MSKYLQRETVPGPDQSERPIPDPLANAPHQLTDHERAAIAGENDDPDILTGRADGTNEELPALFSNEGADHFDDGFAGSGDDERPDDEHLSQNDGDQAVEGP